MCALEREGSTLCVKERERETEGTNAVFVTIFGKDLNSFKFFFDFQNVFRHTLLHVGVITRSKLTRLVRQEKYFLN